MRRATRNARSVVLTLFVAVATVACSGSGEEATTREPETTTTSDPTTAADDTTTAGDTAEDGSQDATPTTGPTTSGATPGTGSSSTTATTRPTQTTAPNSGPATAPTTSQPTTTSTTSTTAPAGPRPLSQVEIALEPAATFRVPTAFRTHPNGSGWIAEKQGVVRSFPDGGPALDIRSMVLDRGEQGLLGLAFSAAGDRLFVHYSDTATAGDTVVAEYAFVGGVAQPGSRREILRVDQPYANHNGGDIHLGPDGMLWIALGDGGSAGDPQENGQNPNTLLGAILRIDPDEPSGGRPYGIPSGNPFADGGGAPEVWLHGVRNPWRIAFDRATGDLWVADVGQDAWEEITVLPASGGRGRGANLGWNEVEGSHSYEGTAPPGSTGPAYEYPHSQGCSITGGYVYRGSAIPELGGAYLFGDLCRSTLRAIRADGNTATDDRVFPVDVGTPIAFGEEASGELLVLTQQGTVHRIVRG